MRKIKKLKKEATSAAKNVLKISGDHIKNYMKNMAQSMMDFYTQGHSGHINKLQKEQFLKGLKSQIMLINNLALQPVKKRKNIQKLFQFTQKKK